MSTTRARTSWVDALAAEWTARAEARSALWAGDPAAQVLRGLADELLQRHHAFLGTEVTIAEAAAQSGYSEAHLRDLAHDGVLPLVDGPGPMRIRRGDLPRKPGRNTRAPQLSSASRALGAQIVGGRRK